MKLGDLVHNVPHDAFGIITSELEPIRSTSGEVIERRLMVLYNKSLAVRAQRRDRRPVLTGSTFLRLVEEENKDDSNS